MSKYNYRDSISLLGLFASFCICLAVVQGASAPSDEEALNKNWKIINQFCSSPVTSIHQTSDFYSKLVRSPRNYTILIEFTTDRNCLGCIEFDNTFKELATVYYQQLDELSSKANLTEYEQSFMAKRIFFIKIKVDEKTIEVAQKMGTPAFPSVLYVPPVSKKGFPHKDYYTIADASFIKPAKLSGWIASHTSVTIGNYLDWESYVWVAVPLLLGAIGAIVLLYCAGGIFALPRSPWFWYFGPVLGVFYLMCAGYVGNAVNANEWSYYRVQTGTTMWLLPSLMRQTRLEGYIGSTLSLGASMIFLLIIWLLPKIKSAWVQRLLFLILFSSMLLAMNTWMQIYCHKNTMYPYQYYYEIPGIFPPPPAHPQRMRY